MSYFNQRDARWKDVPMGKGTGTIGQYGCYLTSLCNGLNAKGYSYTPLSLNDLFKSLNAWVGPYGNYIDVANLNKYLPNLFTGFQQIDPWGSTPATQDIIKNDLVALGRVSAVPIGGAVDGTHFVLITGQQNGVAIIYDPWSGVEEPITKRWSGYGYIRGLRLFNVKPYAEIPEPAPTPVPVDQTAVIDDLKQQLASCQKATNDAITSALAENNQAWQTKLEIANNMVDSLNSQISDLKKSITTLQQAVQNAPQPTDDTKKLSNIHDIIWGNGWPWTKVNKIKVLLPK